MSKAFCKKLLQLLATERRAHTNSNDSNTKGNHEKLTTTTTTTTTTAMPHETLPVVSFPLGLRMTPDDLEIVHLAERPVRALRVVTLRASRPSGVRSSSRGRPCRNGWCAHCRTLARKQTNIEKHPMHAHEEGRRPHLQPSKRRMIHASRQ